MTFSTKDTGDPETSPEAGRTPATGDSDLSPARPGGPGGRGGEETGGVKSTVKGSCGLVAGAAAGTPPRDDSPATDQVEQKPSFVVLPPARNLAEGENDNNGGAGAAIGHNASNAVASAVLTAEGQLDNASMQIDVVFPTAAVDGSSASAVNVPGEGHVTPEVRGTGNQQ